MLNIRLLAILGMLLSAALFAPAPVYADSAALTLDPSEIQTNVQDGAGFWQFDAGDVLLNGQAIGSYRRTKRFGSQAQAGASVTITITVGGDNLTLQGFHTTSSGAESGSVSAASAGLAVAIGAFFSSPNGSVITFSF